MSKASRRQEGLAGTLTSLEKTTLVPTVLGVDPGKSSLDTVVPYLKFPSGEGAGHRDRTLDFGLAMALVGSAADSGNETAWMSYILTHVSLLFPTLLADCPGVSAVPISSDEANTIGKAVQDLLEVDRALGGEVSTDKAALDGALSVDQRTKVAEALFSLFSMMDSKGLPSGSPHPSMYNISQSRDANQIVGHLSLVAFLMGKKIVTQGTGVNVTSITDKRPLAIERKYLEGRKSAILSGAVKLSPASYSGIHAAWNYHGAIRAHLVKGFCQFASSTASPLMEVFNTTFKLLEYSGIQSFIIVKTFLATYEFAWGLTSIQADLQFWESSCKSLLEIDVAYRKYAKLIMADKTSIFRRQNMPKLISLAVKVLGKETPTLLQFVSEDIPSVLVEFERARAMVEAAQTIVPPAQEEEEDGEMV